MKIVDRLLQSWRIRKAGKYIAPGARMLDIGAADGPLFRQITHVGSYVGIDPDLPADRQLALNARLTKGLFPECIKGEQPFYCITMLAVLEHIPSTQQPKLAVDCATHLRPGGYLVITAPSPAVDWILSVLKWLRVIDGMSLEEHYGFDVRRTPELFRSAGFQLLHNARFQLGLNNLFVFVRS
jgi:2-polyprenyl-3-methyl-5-hydroxy-6-metoxy-1,4-benzoquinol methylase